MLQTVELICFVLGLVCAGAAPYTYRDGRFGPLSLLSLLALVLFILIFIGVWHLGTL